METVSIIFIVLLFFGIPIFLLGYGFYVAYRYRGRIRPRKQVHPEKMRRPDQAA